MREALRDYAAALAADPTVTDAALGRTRCEVALGLTPTQGGTAVVARAAPKARISEEDARALNDAQTRVREVKKQQLRSGEQKRMAENDKRRAELTLAQLSQLPDGRAVYTSVGRMYACSSVRAATAKLEEDRAGFEKKIRVCNLTIDHLAKQEKEADSTFLEVLADVKRKSGGA
jgi:chaperonin cofactor prefoldin